jgi:threonine dehydratase
MISFEDIAAAQKTIVPLLASSPCVFSPALSKLCDAKIFLKLENFHLSGSFKERGAINKLEHMEPRERKMGVVAASAGNHAQAVALHATRLGIVSTIFMPRGTPAVKISRTEEYGAQIRIEGDSYDDAFVAASEFAKKTGATYVHAYNDPLIVAGQGTLGLELASQLPTLDLVAVAVGGGGLLAGISLALSHLLPAVECVGVEPESMPSLKMALQAGAPTTVPKAQTVADGIRVRRVGDIPFEICQKFIKRSVAVSEESIVHAILYLLEKQKLVAEGAGAAPVAALMGGALGRINGKTVCMVIGGGNIDPQLLCRATERGMVESGRMASMRLFVHDHPGELAHLLGIVSALGANVVEVHHERAFAEVNLADVLVDLVLQTRGPSHVTEIVHMLTSKGYQLTLSTPHP